MSDPSSMGVVPHERPHLVRPFNIARDRAGPCSQSLRYRVERLHDFSFEKSPRTFTDFPVDGPLCVPYKASTMLTAALSSSPCEYWHSVCPSYRYSAKRTDRAMFTEL